MGESIKFSRSAVMKSKGRTAYYKMLQDVKQGELIKVRRGVYASMEQMSGTMIDINAVVPEGILCLWSAWNIYKLTTSMPQAFHVAIKRGRKVTLPDYPSIDLHHYTEKLLNIGVEVNKIEGFKVKLYNVERSVCDAVKFRNKIGMDVCSEIITNYLNRKDRNLTKLMDYANKLRVASILATYLEVKL